MSLDQSQAVIARFTCEGCGKQYRWKPQLAGRRVKCAKCLTVMRAPEFPPGEESEQSDLYELVPDAPPPRKVQEYEHDFEAEFGATGVATVITPTVTNVVRPIAKPQAKQLKASETRASWTRGRTGKFILSASMLIVAIASAFVIYRVIV